MEEKVTIVLTLLREEVSAAESCRRYGTAENSVTIERAPCD